MALNKRQKKKLKDQGRRCPICKGRDGIVGHFIEGKKHKEVFLYCSSCQYEHKPKKDEKSC